MTPGGPPDRPDPRTGVTRDLPGWQDGEVRAGFGLVRRVVVRVVVPVAALTVVAGCAAQPGRGEGPGRSPEAPASPTVEEDVLIITEADSGGRFLVSLDARVLLRLGNEYVWEEPRAEGRSVELIRVDYFQDPGFSEWEVRPTQPGTTVITATGMRTCPPGAPCPEDAFAFDVAVTVAA